MKLIAALASPYSRKVRIVLAEKKIGFFVKCTVIFYSIGLFHVVPGVTKCGDCKLTCGD